MSAPRRRHGRVRRWLVRPFFWGLAALALAAAALVALAESRWASERAARAFEGWLGQRLGREVSIGSLELDLLPLAAEATAVSIGGLPGAPPLVTAERVLVAADLTAVARPELVLRRVLVERPVLDLRFPEEGGHNLPSWSRRRAAGDRRRLLSVLVGQVEIVGGEVVLDYERLPLELAARQVQGHLFGLEERVLEGRMAAAEVEIGLRDARPYLGSVAVSGRYEPGRVEFRDGRLEAPDLFAVASGFATWGEERRVSIDLEARGRAELLERLGILEAGFAGPARFAGGIAWTPEAWGYRGTASSPSIEVLGRRLGEAVAVVSGDRNGVSVDIERAAYGDGTVGGTVSYRQGAPAGSVEVELGFDRVRLSRLIADQGIPLTGVEGRVDGALSYRFEAGASRRGDGRAALTVSRGGSASRDGSAAGGGAAAAESAPAAAPPAAAGGEPAMPLRMRGAATLSIEAGVVAGSGMRLESAAQRIVAGGSYDLDSGSGRFDYRIDSDRVEELVALLPPEAVDPGSPPLWAPTSGAGTLEGILAIEPAGVSTEVVLELADVVAPGYRAARLRGPLAVSAAGVDRLRLELSRPGGALAVAGSVPFTATEAAGGALELGLDLAGWPVGELRPWLPFAVPFDGQAGGSVRLAGPVERLVGEAALAVEPVAWGGLEAGSLAFEVSFGAARVEIERAVLVAPAGAAEARGGFDRDGGGLEMTISAAALDLGLPPLAGLVPADLGGELTVDGRLAGSLERPRLEVELAAAELTLAGRPLAERQRGAAEIGWQEGRLEARGELPGVARFEGGGRADGTAVELAFDVASERLGSLAALALPQPIDDLGGELAGRLEVRGPATDRLTARLVLERLSARRSGLELVNLEPVALAVDGEALTIESLFVGVPGSEAELFVGGRVGLEAPYPLDLRLQSTLAAEWAELLMPAARLRGGFFEVIGSVGGTLERPDLDGVGRLHDTGLLLASPPLALEEVESTLLFYPDRIVVDRATARVAGGSLQAAGSLSLAGGWTSPTYRFQLRAEDIALRYPEGWLLRGGAELQLGSTPEGRTVQGTIDLERAIYVERVEVGVGSLLEALFSRRRVEVGETDELLASTELNLAVRGPGALRVRNNLADLGGDLELTVRGTAARPVLFGEVGLDPGGKLVYSGLEYRVERGQLSFANPFRVEPVIDLVATTDLREYDVVLTLAGPPDRLNATFASDPPLADLEILALLGGGDGAARRTSAASDSQSAAAEGFLYGQATSLITDRVNRLFGLDRFRIDPLTESTGDLSSARVTVGERLSRDLFATYSYDPSTTEQQILQLEWNVSRSLVLVLTQNGDDSYAVDARWEKSF